MSSASFATSHRPCRVQPTEPFWKTSPSSPSTHSCPCRDPLSAAHPLAPPIHRFANSSPSSSSSCLLRDVLHKRSRLTVHHWTFGLHRTLPLYSLSSCRLFFVDPPPLLCHLHSLATQCSIHPLAGDPSPVCLGVQCSCCPKRSGLASSTSRLGLNCSLSFVLVYSFALLFILIPYFFLTASCVSVPTFSPIVRISFNSMIFTSYSRTTVLSPLPPTSYLYRTSHFRLNSWLLGLISKLKALNGWFSALSFYSLCRVLRSQDSILLTFLPSYFLLPTSKLLLLTFKNLVCLTCCLMPNDFS